MIQDTAWSPRFVPSTTATAATSGEAIAGTDTTKFITPSLLPAATSYHAGPVVNARAPRQGLVFDGTTGGSFTLTSAPSGSWSTDQTALIPTANPSSAIGFFAIGGTYSTDATYAMYISAGGALIVEQNTATPSSYRTGSVSGFRAAYSGKTVRIATTVSSGTLIIYVNGVSVSYSEGTTGGSPPAWGATLGSATSYFGKLTASQYYFNSALGPLYIYNRALSASEVVALYESGAPSGADYQSSTTQAGVNLLTAAQATFTADTYWSKVNTTVDTGTGTATLNATVGGASLTKANSMVVGKRYRVTMEVSSANTTYYVLGNGTLATFTGTGTKTAEFVADGVTLTGCYLNSGTGTVVLDSLQVTPVGLLLAPDAAQAGGGLVWYDTGGNAANITLPASGVSWNVPSSRYLGGNWTVSGNLTVNGTSGNTFNAATVVTPTITSQVNQAFRIICTSTAEVQQGFLQTGNFGYYIQVGGSSSYPLMLQPAGSNVLIGTTTDGGQKLQVNGTALFGTDNASLGAYFDYNGGISGNATLWLKQTTKSSSTYTLTGGGTYTALNAPSGGSIYLRINNSDALTLDSSQNATFAGDIRFSLANTFDIGQTGTRVRNAFIRTLVLTTNTPAAANSTGTAGTVTWDTNYIYVCTATDTWKRVAIATW